MVVDIGVVRNHIKPKANITLYNMRKIDLIEYIRNLEHNYNVAVSFNANQAKYIESLGFRGGVVASGLGWISVKDRLPTKEDAKVIDGYIIAILKGRKPNLMRWSEVASYPHYFTHWMPLPNPPEGGDE